MIRLYPQLLWWFYGPLKGALGNMLLLVTATKPWFHLLRKRFRRPCANAAAFGSFGRTAHTEKTETINFCVLRTADAVRYRNAGTWPSYLLI